MLVLVLERGGINKWFVVVCIEFGDVIEYKNNNLDLSCGISFIDNCSFICGRRKREVELNGFIFFSRFFCLVFDCDVFVN